MHHREKFHKRFFEEFYCEGCPLKTTRLRQLLFRLICRGSLARGGQCLPSLAASTRDAGLPLHPQRARGLALEGFKPLDALHVASAAAGGASHFLTVDDGILKKRERVKEIVIASPLEFVQSFGAQL
jgi:hypothetical protein